MQEIFKDINGYEGLYEVSNIGTIRKSSGKILKTNKDKDGYLYLGLSKKGTIRKTMKVHRLVCMAFHDGDFSLQVNHKNGIKNDNRVENLEWCTQGENLLHSYRELGRKYHLPTMGWNKGIKGKETKVSRMVYQFSKEGLFIKKWECISDIERELKIFTSNICATCRGKQKSAGGFIWKYTLNTL